MDWAKICWSLFVEFATAFRKTRREVEARLSEKDEPRAL